MSAGDGSVESSPLTSLAAAGSGTPEQPFASRPSPFSPGHVNAPMFQSSEMPSTGEDHANPLARARRGAPPHVGQRGRPPHIFIDVREHRLDLSSPAVACELEAACAPAASADRCFHEHDRGPHEHPNHRICGWGDCPISTELPRSRAITEKARGQGSRKTAPRRSPRRLLVAETLPQPWPFRAPPVAAIALSPCPE